MHKEGLTKDAAKLFPRFNKFKGFYLVGGTALALWIGHRISVDFDFFSERELPLGLLQKVRRVFQAVPVRVAYRVPGQLTIFLGGIKTTFFHYPYPVVKRLGKHEDVPIATVFEIAAMKAFSIGKRLSYKDYIDWYFLLRERHVKLEQVIKLARKKFNGDFNARLFLGQLASISDVPTLEIDFLRDKIGRQTIEKFLKRKVRNFKL